MALSGLSSIDLHVDYIIFSDGDDSSSSTIPLLFVLIEQELAFLVRIGLLSLQASQLSAPKSYSKSCMKNFKKFPMEFLRSETGTTRLSSKRKAMIKQLCLPLLPPSIINNLPPLQKIATKANVKEVM